MAVLRLSRKVQTMGSAPVPGNLYPFSEIEYSSRSVAYEITQPVKTINNHSCTLGLLSLSEMDLIVTRECVSL